MKLCVIACSALMLSGLRSIVADEPMNKTETITQREAAAQLELDDLPDLQAFHAKLMRERKYAIGVLLKTARGGAEAENDLGDLRRRDSIKLLGILRAAEAADDLAQILTFTPRLNPVGEPAPLNSYPAADALVHIGVPAHRAIFQRLHHPVTDAELKICAYILSAYAGSVDAPTGTFYVRRHKPNSKAFPQLQQNLEAIESIMNSPAFGKLSDWPEPQSEPQKVPERIRRETIPVPRIQSR